MRDPTLAFVALDAIGSARVRRDEGFALCPCADIATVATVKVTARCAIGIEGNTIGIPEPALVARAQVRADG
jgi:hypothetical protein